jgi:2-oxoglutarate ferredoxin oxidoreductase subunit alpha
VADPDVADLPDLPSPSPPAGHARRRADVPAVPRDPETLARPVGDPGTPGLEHRIGGIEKADGTGNISYDPDNHD